MLLITHISVDNVLYMIHSDFALSLRDIGKIVNCSATHVHDILIGNRRANVSED
jgi:hypothetical protein